ARARASSRRSLSTSKRGFPAPDAPSDRSDISLRRDFTPSFDLPEAVCDAIVIRSMQRLRRFLPWLVGLALLAHMLLPDRHVDHRADLVAAFRRAPWWTLGIALTGIVGAYLADTLATWWVLAWAKVRMRFREVAVIRGVTYLLNTINYSLGQAAMI